MTGSEESFHDRRPYADLDAAVTDGRISSMQVLVHPDAMAARKM
jgi:hypothetical protein